MSRHNQENRPKLIHKPYKRLAPVVIYLSILTVSCASQGQAPVNVGDGQLAPCPDRPNCVSSEAGPGRFQVEALAFDDAPEAAWIRLKQVIQEIGGEIQKDTQGYMWAIFKTRLFRFVDDVEFRMDATHRLIHVRSASRVGYLDFGVNRRRVEALRRKFAPQPHSQDGA